MDDRVAITLLRHGMTADNERSAYIGWSDPPLSKKGRTDVEKLKEQMEMSGLQSVFLSDLKRCRETAEILFPSHSIHKMHELREIHFGHWEGKTYEQLKNVAAYQNWLHSPLESGPDGGEQFIQFANRVKEAFEKIKEKMLIESLRNVAVVTHGGVIRYLLMVLMKSDKTYFDWKVPYGGGYRLSWSKQSFRRGEMCTSLQEVPLMERQHGLGKTFN